MNIFYSVTWSSALAQQAHWQLSQAQLHWQVLSADSQLVLHLHCLQQSVQHFSGFGFWGWESIWWLGFGGYNKMFGSDCWQWLDKLVPFYSQKECFFDQSKDASPYWRMSYQCRLTIIHFRSCACDRHSADIDHWDHHWITYQLSHLI